MTRTFDIAAATSLHTGMFVGEPREGYFGSTYPHVGSLSGARAAVDGRLGQELGHGVFRACYRGIGADSRWCYKVAHRPEGDQGSLDELVHFGLVRHAGIDRLTTLCPPADAWYVRGRLVLAMPYYPHAVWEDPTGNATRQLMDLRSSGIIEHITGSWAAGDLHDGNFRLTAAYRLRLIDLGTFVAPQWR